MTTHELKTDPGVFEAVHSGKKTFEIRLNDRGFCVGDELSLRETRSTGEEMRNGAPLEYTGRHITKIVSHVLTGYGLVEGWCCLSFEASLDSFEDHEIEEEYDARDLRGYEPAEEGPECSDMADLFRDLAVDAWLRSSNPPQAIRDAYWNTVGRIL